MPTISQTKNPTKILIVDDEQGIREMLFYALVKHGYSCIEAEDVKQAEGKIKAEKPNLILLDWMLPGMSGIDYVSHIKTLSHAKNIPIIMLSAKQTEEDKIEGLKVGSDDYITKPFSIKEMLARIEAVLRRYPSSSIENIVKMSDIVLDLDSYQATIKNKELPLSSTEFKLLHFFISHPDKAYTRAQLLDQVWGDHIYVEERSVDAYILRLRKKLTPYQCDMYIQTVHGFGYRFSTQ